MTAWTTHFYRFRVLEDAKWQAAISAYPTAFCLQAEIDLDRTWIVDLPIVAAVLIYLSLKGFGVESLGEGRLSVPEAVRCEVVNILRNQTKVRGRWWTLRRAHFASQGAQTAFEALL